MAEEGTSDGQPGPQRRRTRRRASAPGGPPPTPADVPPSGAAGAQRKADRRPDRSGREQSPATRERGLRNLVGSGSSQVGTLPAMRARDVGRPSDEQIAAAERDVELVRRHYTPPPARPERRD
ncbi:MAG: hypothetical protein ACR2F6_04015 [Mycobacteriales bacterium]